MSLVEIVQRGTLARGIEDKVWIKHVAIFSWIFSFLALALKMDHSLTNVLKQNS